MATSEATMAYILDQLQSLRGLRARKMFGEYAVYYQEKVVALVCDNELFVKITPEGKALLGEQYAEGLPYPGAKSAMRIAPEVLEDADRLSGIIRVTARALPSAIGRK